MAFPVSTEKILARGLNLQIGGFELAFTWLHEEGLLLAIVMNILNV